VKDQATNVLFTLRVKKFLHAEREEYNARRGMTLLELILALSISAMILGAVAMAIQLHLRVLDSRRAQMEESQLARAILRRMADDLRSSVQQETTDFSGLAEAAAASASASSEAISAALGGADGASGGASGSGGAGGSQSSGNGQSGGNNNQGGANQGGANQGGGNQGSGQGGGNQTSGNQSGNQGGNQGGNQSGGGAVGGGSGAGSGGSGAGAVGGSRGSSSGSAGTGGFSSGGAGSRAGSRAGGSGAASSAATSSETTVETEEGPPLPGVYGDGVQLRIDSSRLPRVEEFDAIASGAADANDLPSDVKTITWSLAAANGGASGGTGAGMASESFGGASTSGGLMRRQVDRAVQGYADYAGMAGSQDGGDELIAPEVTTLEYRYFDGSQWLTEWDMDTQQALPMAVEITLGISPLETLDASASATGSATGDPTGSSTAGNDSQERRYRMVVHLPAARPAEASTDTSTGTSTGSSSEEVSP
jgi:prepilin-type N-terminal cleavage/methylation domain-containing protein